VIAVLVPVLNRPASAARVAANIALNTTVPYRLVFICSPGDHHQIVACAKTSADVLVTDWDPTEPGDYGRKINHAFAATMEPFVFTGADDLDFRPAWAEAALKAADATGVGVVGTNDGGNPVVKRGLHSTHSLVRRAYIDQHGGSFDMAPGQLYPVCYDHQCVDNELVDVAKARNEWAFAPLSLVTHLHPFWDRTVRKDATYEKALRNGMADRRLFEQRKRSWQRGRVAA
jgi:hypothetical protein